MTTRSSRPAHRPSARVAMLDAAEAHLGDDGTLTLDSAARAAGVTKAGLMYHFPTKEELLAAVLEHLMQRYESELLEAVRRRAGADAAELSAVPAAQRHLAYLDWACGAALSPADLVIFADPKLRVPLTERWQAQLERWLEVPAGTGQERRHRLLAVRLLADGAWFDRACGLLEISAPEAESLDRLALDLLGEVP